MFLMKHHNFDAWSLQWPHNEGNGVSNHLHHNCLFNRLFWRRSKKTSKLRVTGLCEGNSPVTGEFPAQRASNAENVSIWWRHHDPNIFHTDITEHRIFDGPKLSNNAQGAVSIRKTVLPGMAIPMLKIRRPNGRLIFNMGIAIPSKTVFLIETAPWRLLICCHFA